ncbi:MAG: CDP-diacylglycerol--glycerol-3-phosphate 3-phosphatidyltransferase [Planctomycetota bacterium]|nr:CDP-diacylglycerol--glycerol-3-phosphate 3-phosphatidyltransferase [Planctomycetota bacterium]
MNRALQKRIPNVITLMRIVIAAGFFVALTKFHFNEPEQGIFFGNLAIVLFVVGALTDFIDGYLARKWDVVSMFGRIMDPFCDKVLVLGAFIYFSSPRFMMGNESNIIHMATGVYPWMVVVVIARELLVTAIRDVLESIGYSGGANWAGKAKMILQSIAIPAILLITVNFKPDVNGNLLFLNQILVWLVLVVTVLSSIPYISGLLHVMRKSESES